MRTARLALAAAIILAISLPVIGAEKVFEGTLVCAKCYLKRPDAKECQDVLLVPESGGTKAEYYITKNEVWKAAGEACMAEVKAKVTGTVGEKDKNGRLWLTPSKIEKQ